MMNYQFQIGESVLKHLLNPSNKNFKIYID